MYLFSHSYVNELVNPPPPEAYDEWLLPTVLVVGAGVETPSELDIMIITVKSPNHVKSLPVSAVAVLAVLLLRSNQ